MNIRNWNGNKTAACIILSLLFFYGGFSLVETVPEFRKAAENHMGDTGELIARCEDAATEHAFMRYRMIEAYGAIQKLLIKHEENAFEVVKDQEGYLYGGNFWSGFGDDQQVIALRIQRLFEKLKSKGTDMAFIMAPMKTVREEARYSGIPYNSFEAEADSLMRYLRYYSVPSFDMRKSLAESGLAYEQCFYRTDHHWRTEAVFQTYTDILHWMEESYGISMDPGHVTCDLSNYDPIVYEDVMFGAQGRKTGLIYAGGKEDMTVYFPHDNGWFSKTSVIGTDSKLEEGGFDQVLFDKKLKISDFYKDSAYDIGFLDNLDDFISITNHNSSGPKVLLIRDSFASATGVYLAQNCSRLDLLYLLNYTGDEIEAYVENNDYDFVFVMLYPENLSTNKFTFYQEGEDETDQ